MIFNNTINAQRHLVDSIFDGAYCAHDLLRLLPKAGLGDVGFSYMEAVRGKLFASQRSQRLGCGSGAGGFCLGSANLRVNVFPQAEDKAEDRNKP